MLKMKPLAGAFLLLLCLSLLHPCLGVSHRETVVVFQEDHTDILYKDAASKTITSKGLSFTNPAFVSGLVNKKSFFAIISGAVFSNPLNNMYQEVIARTSYKNYKTWSSAEALTNLYQNNRIDEFCEGTTAVMKENKIYVLVAATGKFKISGRMNDANTVREPIMIVGTVMNRTVGKIDDVFIKWEAPIFLKVTHPNTLTGGETFKFVGGGGNGIVTASGTIIFPIILTKNRQTFSSTLYSSNNGETWNIGAETEPGTTAGSLVEWNDGKLLFTVASNEGYRKGYESNDMGITWKPSPVLYGVWGNQATDKHYKTQGSSIAVSINGNNVLLFSHPLNKYDHHKLNTLQLWLSDGQRIVCVGTISDKEIEDNTEVSILSYIGEKLYVMHQINQFTPLSTLNESMTKKWRQVIGITPLPDLFDKVKIKVSHWQVMDERYKNKGIPINGLVAVLGNTKEKDNLVWADMYNCVHATVKGGESVDGGFRFNGKPGSGAKWPVQSQGQNQLYKFTENAFTITATVTIDTPSGDGDISLIGASADSEGKSVLIGLGYKKEKKWYVVKQSGTTLGTGVEVVLGQEYNVAITFANGESSVYVNGVAIGKEKISNTNTVSIDHFFIGGTGLSSQSENGIFFTVKNVMLFSRALEKREIDTLKDITGISELNEAIIKEYERIEQQIKEAALAVKLQSAGGTQDLTSNAQSTRKPEIGNTFLQNRITSASENGKSGSNTKSTISSEGHQSASNTQLTRTAGKQKINSNTKEMSEPKNTQTDLRYSVSAAPTSQESLSTKRHNEETGVLQQSVTTEKEKNNKILNSLQKYGTAGVQTNIPGDNGAIVSLAAIYWMSLFCALISVTVF